MFGSVLLGLSAAHTLFLMGRSESQRLEDQWTEAGLAMAQATEDTLEVSMLNDAPQDIRQAVRNVQQGELVEGVSVYGIDGEAWVQSDVSVEHSEIRHDALPGYDEKATEHMPHAWRAGPQTVLQRRQLVEMPAGGLVVMAIPANPYRCPPGPYERASLIAHFLKTQNPRGNLLGRGERI